MACDRYLNTIHELVDGTLGPLRKAELELHLESCDECRALAADLQEVARAAAALDTLEPPAHVWPQIVSGLQQEGRVPAGPTGASRHLNYTVLALAAALVIAVGASLVLLRGERARLVPQQAASPVDPDGNDTTLPPVQSFVQELTKTEQHLQNAIEQATRSEDAMSAQTAAVVQKNLQVINKAIAETSAALETNPRSATARQTLYETLRQKIQFLQDTIALMNEMRQGDAAGAAQIVEGGKS